MSHCSVAGVAVENSLPGFDELYSFIIPDAIKSFVFPGSRVMVPFGRGNVKRQGFVFSVEQNQDPDVYEKLKYIDEVLDLTPVLNEELLKLALFVRERTFCTYFSAAKAILPGGMCLVTEKTYLLSADIAPENLSNLSEDALRVVAFLRKQKDYCRESEILKKCKLDKSSTLLKLLEHKGLLCANNEAFARVRDLSIRKISLAEDYDIRNCSELTPKQRTVAEFLYESGCAELKEICYYTGVTPAVVKLLIQKGICSVLENEVYRAPEITYVASPEKTQLSDAQKKVFTQLSDAYERKKGETALLYGVTGSGKTQVYAQIINRVLENGQDAIVLVPEISLTPQTAAKLKSQYGDNVALLHSGLSTGERYDEFKRIRNGNAHVVVGTRSAVFAPLKNIGVIIVDEEQEHTYKSETNPRYSAKDVAKFRSAYHHALLILASATPSIESYAKAKAGTYLLCELTQRYGKALLPEVKTVDMTDTDMLQSGSALSVLLEEEIKNNLACHEQSILLVNRRGCNTFVSCQGCKTVLSCPNCSISLTYHSANNRLMCHYCGYSTPFAENCPVCGDVNVRYAGFGTQRIESELKYKFPSARILRMDADTTSMHNAHDKAFAAFANGDYDIMIGTQMVAKGLDFSNVTLVGVVCADKELYNDNYKSAEKTFALITQVVGRAGRGDKKGRAVIQTVSPDNIILSLAAKQDYPAFFEQEIYMRKALIYPPYCDICCVGFSGHSKELTKECAEAFLRKLKDCNINKYSQQHLIVLGPALPRVSKINNSFRYRILIKCKNNAQFRGLIREVLQYIYQDKNYREISVFADINPENADS